MSVLKNKNIARFLLSFFVITFFSTVASSVMPAPPAQAASFNELTSTTDKIKAYYLYQGWMDCINIGSMDTSIPETDAVNPMQWEFNDRAASVGYIVDPADGMLGCNEIYRDAARIFGVSDYTGFLSKLGYRLIDGTGRNSGSKYWTFESCSNYVGGGQGVQQSTDLKNCFINHAAFTTFGTPAIDTQMYIVRNKTTLDNEVCGVHFRKADTLTQDGWATFKSDYQYQHSEYNSPTLNLLNINTASPAANLVLYYAGSKKKLNGSGYELGSKNNGDIHETATCMQMLNALSNLSVQLKGQIDQEILNGTFNAGGYTNGIQGAEDSNLIGEENKTSCAIDGIGWIVCPVINFMAKIADGAFGFLATNFLETKPAMLDTTTTTYQVWSQVRNIANGLFVLAFMLIIFSQMTSIGITNYGIKRMLPRLIIAAILVNISYFVCQLAVDVSNILGYSIKNIFEGIGAASNNLAPSQISANQGATGEGFAGIAGKILAITVGGTLIYLMIGTLAPVLIAAIVALVMILFILVARQALVIMLVIISPLAFVAYLLPNTEQWFKKWQKTFIAMLMLFPIVATVFGASSLAAFIITSTFGSGIAGDSSNFFGQIIGAAVGILPLFVVPGLLKKSLDGAGSLVAKVAGKASSLGGSPSQKFSKAVGESRIGQFKRFREGEGVRKRNLIQAGAYRGRNPVTGLASKLNKGLNARTGKFGERSAATGVTEIHKAENEEIENEMKMQEHNSSPTTMREDTVKNFEDAVKSGNTVKARASQRILATQLGAPGVEALHESLLGLTAENGGGNTGTLTELQRDINSLGLKGKDVTLSTYGYTGGKLSDIENYNKTIRTTDNNGNDTGPKDPFSGLTSVELAGQSAKQLRDAVKAGFLTAGQATSVLGNANATQGMSQEKIAIFEGLKTPQQPGPEPTIVTANDHNWQSRL